MRAGGFSRRSAPDRGRSRGAARDLRCVRARSASATGAGQLGAEPDAHGLVAVAMMPSASYFAPELVNPVPVEEIPGWVRTMSTTFLGDPDGPHAARWVDLLTRRPGPLGVSRRHRRHRAGQPFESPGRRAGALVTRGCPRVGDDPADGLRLAAAARRAGRAGRATLCGAERGRPEVIDDDADGFASGRYRLRAEGDEVECQRTDRDADLEITQRALAPIYLGGFRLRELLLSRVARDSRGST
jgi:hypothetical protein